jgi:hypothetical protein
MAKTYHTCNGGDGPIFGRKTPGCPRCEERRKGALPRSWGSTYIPRPSASRPRETVQPDQLVYDAQVAHCRPLAGLLETEPDLPVVVTFRGETEGCFVAAVRELPALITMLKGSGRYVECLNEAPEAAIDRGWFIASDDRRVS